MVVGALLPLGEAFPEDWRIRVAPTVNQVVAWIEKNLYPVTDAIKNVVSQYLQGRSDGAQQRRLGGWWSGWPWE